MEATHPKFRRESAERRRDDLIEATLSLIATYGPAAATSRAIAAEANVTQGLIRHYFATKEALIAAAFEYHMMQMMDIAALAAISAKGSALDRLKAFITASLTPPVVNPRGSGIWAGFMTMVQHDPRIRDTHRRAYIAYRNRLEALIAAACDEAGKLLPKKRLTHCAIACNAVIDGLWLEGSVLPDSVSEIALPQIGMASIGAMLDLDMGTRC